MNPNKCRARARQLSELIIHFSGKRRRFPLLTDPFHVLASSSTDEREQEEDERPTQEKEELPLEEVEEDEKQEEAKEEVVEKEEEEEMEVDGEVQQSHGETQPPPS